MVGAHLDSVPEGPGINDNGSGVAAVLETALQLGRSPQVHERGAVRFLGRARSSACSGPTTTSQSLNVDALKDIALYLNFDMLGSPNPGYFTYDGDQSTPPNDNDGVPRVPEGSAGIERTLVAYLKGAGKPREDTVIRRPVGLRRLHQGGGACGRPLLRRRGEEDRRAGRAWGGQANEPFDPNYHKPTDTLDHIDRDGARDQRRRGGIRGRASTRRIRAAATACRSATTAPGTCSNHEGHGRGHGRCGGGADVVFVHRRPHPHQTCPANWPARSAPTACTRTCASCRRSPTPTGATGPKARPATTPAWTTSRRCCGTRVSTSRHRSSSGSSAREGGNPTLTVSGRGYPVDQASLLVATPPGGLNAITLRPQKAPRLHRRRLRHDVGEGRDRRRRRHRLLGRRQAEHRGRQGRRRAACRQRARHRRQPGGSVHAGLLPAAHGSGRGDRHRRRRGAASHQRTGAAGAGQQGPSW